MRDGERVSGEGGMEFAAEKAAQELPRQDLHDGVGHGAQLRGACAFLRIDSVVRAQKLVHVHADVSEEAEFLGNRCPNPPLDTRWQQVIAHLGTRSIRSPGSILGLEPFSPPMLGQSHHIYQGLPNRSNAQ